MRHGARPAPRLAGPVVEANLEAISPGRAAASDGRGGLAEGERAFYTFMSDILMCNEPAGGAGGGAGGQG